MNEEPYKIGLRLSTNEAQKLITNAKACGLTRTAYLRRLLNGYDLKPRPSAELEALRTEIHQIGNNINQIARKAKPVFTPKPKLQPYHPHPKYTGFLALYFHYCYLLGRIEKRQYPPRMSPHLRKEIMKADVYKARLKFLQENNITTADDLTACLQQAENEVTQLAKQRTILNVRKKKHKKLFDALAAEAAFAGFEPRKAEYDDAKEVLDTCGIPREALLAEKADLYEQLAQVNQQIRQERWKLKQCKEISETAVIMQRDIDRVEQQPQRIADTRQR